MYESRFHFFLTTRPCCCKPQSCLCGFEGQRSGLPRFAKVLCLEMCWVLVNIRSPGASHERQNWRHLLVSVGPEFRGPERSCGLQASASGPVDIWQVQLWAWDSGLPLLCPSSCMRQSLSLGLQDVENDSTETLFGYEKKCIIRLWTLNNTKNSNHAATYQILRCQVLCKPMKMVTWPMKQKIHSPVGGVCILQRRAWNPEKLINWCKVI